MDQRLGRSHSFFRAGTGSRSLRGLKTLPLERSRVGGRAYSSTYFTSGIGKDYCRDDNANRHLGGRFKFVRRDGSLFFGELLAVEGSHLRVKREMQGGMVEHGVPKKELAELRPIY